MKKYLFMAVAGILALSSCSKDNDELVNRNTPHRMTFVAGYADGVETRATMDFSTKQVCFDANDSISILSTKNTNAKFTTTDGGASATFSGTASDDATFYAVYPYTAGLALDGTTIHGVTIPTTQLAGYNLIETNVCYWNKNAPIALASAKSGEALKFINLCALLKVAVMDDNDNTKIQITANESLTGTFDLNASTGVLTVTSGQNSVGTDQVINSYYETVYVYLAVAPGAYTNFNLSLINDNNGTQTNSKASVTFEAGKIYDLGSYSFIDPEEDD